MVQSWLKGRGKQGQMPGQSTKSGAGNAMYQSLGADQRDGGCRDVKGQCGASEAYSLLSETSSVL